MSPKTPACSFTLAASMSLTLAAAAGPTSPTFTDATASRLSAAVDVGSGDTSEKDYGIGDLDNDGDLDVVVGRRVGLNGNNGLPLPNTLLMNVDGVLTDMTAALAPDLLNSQRTRDVVVADFNNDGWLDVVVADGPFTAPAFLINLGEVRGDTWAGLAAMPSAIPAGFNLDAWSVAAGDLANDDDPYPDLFFGVRTGNDRVLINNGPTEGGWTGFSDESSRLGPNAATSAVRSSQIIDMNGDGDEDIVEGVTAPTGAARMLANDGSGQFGGAPQSLVTGACYNFGLGDLDGNGVMDIFGVRNGSDQYRVNTGPAASDTIGLGPLFTAPDTNGFGAICRVADINNDGTDDFFVTDLDQEFPQDCARWLKILVNSGSSPYLSAAYVGQQPWTPNGTSDIAIIDLDDDGDLDMLVGHCTGNSVFLQDGSPILPGDLDGDGDVDFADLLELLASWGDCPVGPACPADLDDSGSVGFADLLILLSNWS